MGVGGRIPAAPPWRTALLRPWDARRAKGDHFRGGFAFQIKYLEYFVKYFIKKLKNMGLVLARGLYFKTHVGAYAGRRRGKLRALSAPPRTHTHART